MAEIWTMGVASPRGAMRAAQAAEQAGFDGMYVVDSQNLSGDCFVALAMAATVTTRLKLGTGVSNSVTRTAAANATGIASVQRVSNGRAVFGIGRGDSALAHLGRAPARIRQFERYVKALRAFLAGEAVAFADIDIPDSFAPEVGSLDLADSPKQSRIAWIVDGAPKVPLEVAATGPKVISIAARYTDRVMFTVGADRKRLAWGMETAAAARKHAGLPEKGVGYGAYINVVSHPDIPTARRLVRGGLTTFARFSVMHGDISGPVDEAQRRVLGALHDRYDMKAHTRSDSQQADVLTDQFIDQFAIAGPPELCVERLRALLALGFDKLAISGASAGSDPEEGRRARELFVREVLPRLR